MSHPPGHPKGDCRSAPHEGTPVSALLDIEALLKRSLGLDAASIGVRSLERAVRQRAAASGAADLPSYWQQLQHSTEELQELTESVVVPETWFYRDPAAFEAVSQFLREQPRGAPMRLLSLPCATGEEPYSLAMTLLGAGWQPSQFRIDAVDISRRALAAAQRGEYGRNAFRSADLGYRERYFEPLGEGRYRVGEAVRSAVRWQQANLFADELLADLGPYQIVFCRNLLIYFDRPAQERALSVLSRLLAEPGWLFVGPSEGALLLEAGFEWLKLPRAFAFQRSRTAPPAALKPVRRVPAAQPAARATAVSAAPAPNATGAPAAPAPPQARNHLLQQASQLADQGRLAEAEQACNAHLKTEPASAQAMYLLGLLADARGDMARATDHYRRALYVDPGHEEALLHLASLRAKQGDEDGAKRLQQRARRLHEAAWRGPK